VPGPITEVYSGLAEAYGVLMALSFLQQDVAHFPLTIGVTPCIYMCCNNKGVIDRINNYQYQPVNPNHTLFNEYGLHHAIHLIHRSFIPIAIKYIYILGHQDQQNKNKPSLEAQLNIEYNAAAGHLHMQLQKAQYPQHHLFIPMAHPYLTLCDHHVICQVKQNL